MKSKFIVSALIDIYYVVLNVLFWFSLFPVSVLRDIVET